MFYYVEGKVAMLTQGLAVVDCGGVGYACHTSQNTIGAVQIGNKAKLYTYLYVREDMFDLYGFADMEELNCFKMLINVSGVGPKAALAILSTASPSRLALSIMTGNEKMLMQAPGIGKKIAQRIIMELRDKIAKEQMDGTQSSVPFLANDTNNGVNHTQEAVAALMVLGYSQSEALCAMEGMPREGMNAEEIIRHSLKKLGAQ